MESLRKSHEEELSKLQSKKEACAELATRRYVDLMRGRFGISRKEWKEALKEWEKKMDAKSEDESDTSTSSDKENGNRKGKKGGDDFGECGGTSYHPPCSERLLAGLVERPPVNPEYRGRSAKKRTEQASRREER